MFFSKQTNDARADLGEYLQGFIAPYYDEIGEAAKKELLERIVSDDGNKKYVANQEYGGKTSECEQYCIAKNNEVGKSVFELDCLKDFPDINSSEFAAKVLSEDSYVHKAMQIKVENLIKKFTSNNSKASKDLRELLEKSDVEYRVRKGRTYNGSCAFRKGKNGENNKIVICLSDCISEPERENILPELLAHEFGHAVDFSKRPDNLRYCYMDGSETAADLFAASLLAHAHIEERGFSDFMGKDYQSKCAKGEPTEMMYTPNGGFRQNNFVKARNALAKVKTNANVFEKLAELSGRSEEQKSYVSSKQSFHVDLAMLNRNTKSR